MMAGTNVGRKPYHASAELIERARNWRGGNQRRLGIFLGAGASAPLGMPTMNGFFAAWLGENFRHRLDQKIAINDPTQLILNLLRLAYPDPKTQTYDLERVISLLEAVRAIVDAGSTEHLAAYQLTVELMSNQKRSYSEMAQRLETLRTNVTQQGELFDQATELLLSRFHDVFGPMDLQKVGTVWDEPLTMTLEEHGLPIFVTTNYDRVVETLVAVSDLKSVTVVDGFQFREDTQACAFAPEAYWNTGNGDLMLLKLHGSVHWYLRNDELRRSPHDEWEGPTGSSRRAMVTPAVGKARDEWATTLYRYFDAIAFVVDRWLVIGFSFRDSEIREIFSRHLERGEIKHCVILAPTETEPDNSGIEELVAEHSDRVTWVRGKFGEDAFYEALGRVAHENAESIGEIP